jgi:hypothetical protein
MLPWMGGRGSHSFRCGLRCVAPLGLWEFWGDDYPQLLLWATMCRPFRGYVYFRAVILRCVIPPGLDSVVLDLSGKVR